MLASSGFCITLSSLYLGFGLPLCYYIGFILVSCSLILSLTKGLKYQLLIVSLLFLMIGFVPIARYRSVLWRDPQWEYATMRIFQQQGRVFIISPHLQQPFHYSGFPALHLIIIQLSCVSGIPMSTLSVYASPFLSLLSMILIERLIYLFTKNSKASILGATIYTIWPASIYYRSQLIRQNLAFILFLAVLYLYSCARLLHSRKYGSLCILTFVALTLAHHYTAFIMLYLLVGITVIDFLFPRARAKNNLGKLSILSVLFVSITCFYWLTYAEPVMLIVIEAVPGMIMRLTSPVYETMIHGLEVPTPLSINVFSFLRIIFVGFLTIYGVLLSIKAHKKSAKFYISVFLLLLTMTILGFLWGIIADPVRGLLFLSVPISLLAALPLYSMRHRLLVLSLGVILLPTMFNLWGFTYAPMYLYDPSISTETRYHAYCYSPTGYIEAASWLVKNTDPKQSIYVPSDVRMESTLYAYMEVPFYYGIYRVAYREKEVYGKGFQTIISEFSSSVYLIVSKDFSMSQHDLAFVKSHMSHVYENNDCHIFARN